jgi:putative DNA-invertase from lambdoid prophage Rac
MMKAVQNALLGFMAALGEAQAEATKEAQRAGIAHAKENDATAYRGRKPSFSRDQFNTVMCLKGTTNASQIAKTTGLQRMAVARIIADPSAAETMLKPVADVQVQKCISEVLHFSDRSGVTHPLSS